MNKTVKTILILCAVYLLITIPQLIKIYNIREIYLDKEVRTAVVNGVFYIRDQTGYALADLRVFQVEREGDSLHIEYRYHYMGNVDPDEYDDIDRTIILAYDMKTGAKEIVA